MWVSYDLREVEKAIGIKFDSTYFNKGDPVIMAIEELLNPIQPQVIMPVQELHQASSDEEDEEMKVDAEESSNYQMGDETEEVK
jgi:hypothetical protein